MKPETADFDLLQYVQASCHDDTKIGDDIINKLLTFEEPKNNTSLTEEMKKCPIFLNDNIDLLERAIDCPASPFCKSEEIVDYVDSSSPISISSGSSGCQDEAMEEPDWLSTWDSF